MNFLSRVAHHREHCPFENLRQEKHSATSSCQYISKFAVVLNQELSNTSFIATAQAQAGMLKAQLWPSQNWQVLLSMSLGCVHAGSATRLSGMSCPRMESQRDMDVWKCMCNIHGTQCPARRDVPLFAVVLLAAVVHRLPPLSCPRPPPRTTYRLRLHVFVAVAV